MRTIEIIYRAGALSLLLGVASRTTASDYTGLWVGRAAVSHVNEVAIPLDENNTPIAPNPNVPTPAHDEAYIRLLLHVNGAGQVSLLRDVAVLKEDPAASQSAVTESESGFVLVTDERLYSEFPQQEALRFASAVFDFGDFKATEAVNVIVDRVVGSVAKTVVAKTIKASDSDFVLRAAETAAEDMGKTNQALVAAADVNAEFDSFLKEHLSSSELDNLVQTVPLDVSGLQVHADALYAASFYGDDRARRLLVDLTSVVDAATNSTLKKAAAHNLVSRYADFENGYQRFINGRAFGDMIEDAAEAAGVAAITSNATPSSIRIAVDGEASVTEARFAAINIQVAAYEDSAAADAVETVLNRIIGSASTNASSTALYVSREAEAAGLDGLRTEVPRYALQQLAPSEDYSAFVRSDSFGDAVEIASEAAALAAVKEAKNDAFHTEQTLRNAAKIAAVRALNTVYAEAARARQTELPLSGAFGVGQGDARLVSSISNQDAPLGAAGLSGSLRLPASHPTNPFRHRRHPDHTVGIDIQRELRFDFDGADTNQVTSGNFGVDRITGVFREEIFGLHKPLGPDPDTQPIGLKVEGTFELNRVSKIDTLNAL